MAKASRSPFDRSLFQFLGELALNNERTWFEQNKDRYEISVREPALAFIRAMAPHVASISRHLRANDRKVGGSLMRVHRDVRFSRDKTPYKTNVGIQFRHEMGKDVHAPGLYLHIEVGSVFLGVGMWHPEKDALAAVRASILDDPAAWKRVRDGKRFRDHWALAGDSLTRPPKGVPTDHPMIEDLKRKDHVAVTDLKPSAVTKAGFVDQVAALFATAKPLMKWQASALGLPF